jgi:hypothetical protein
MADTKFIIRIYLMKRFKADEIRFGLHYDMHANEADTLPGTGISREYLIDIFKRLQVDFVQADTKGHGGYTSWFSKSLPQTVPPGLKADQLLIWAEACREMNIPLHCHFSGIFEKRATELHPHWAVKNFSDEVPMDPNGQNAGAPPEFIICPRSDYLEEYMIPQMKELITDYKVNGFWIDGDLWAVQPCYCDLCTAEFSKRTGIKKAPVTKDDADWSVWINFVRESFEEYVRFYVEEIHHCNPSVQVCSNWMQTLRHPGEPLVPTDWISGDNTWVFGYDDSRVEAKFLSTRAKPWDIMIWNFYKMHAMKDPTVPWTPKPPEMVMQEAACILAHGGSLQIYENGAGIRDGRFVPWRIKELEKVGTFISNRKESCAGTMTVPQIAVLHSEYHARRTMTENLMWGVDVTSVRGATYGLLENHYGVDVMDEWALLPVIDQFPIVVVPEQSYLSENAVKRIEQYVFDGGAVLLSGPDLINRFSAALIGAEVSEIIAADSKYEIPLKDKTVGCYSSKWADLQPGSEHISASFSLVKVLHQLPLVDESATSISAVTTNNYGAGKVVCFTGELFNQYFRTRYPLQRELIRYLVYLTERSLIGITAPLGVDITYRKTEKSLFIHLVNRLSGTLTSNNDGAVIDIPPCGPVNIDLESFFSADRIRLNRPATFNISSPTETELFFKNNTIHIPYVNIHEIIKMEI